MRYVLAFQFEVKQHLHRDKMDLYILTFLSIRHSLVDQHFTCARWDWTYRRCDFRTHK